MKTTRESFHTLAEADRENRRNDSNWSLQFPRTQREAGWSESGFRAEEYQTPWLAWISWAAVGIGVWALIIAALLTFR